MTAKKKVALGLSGGVDSAIAAVKLLEAGYEVTGVFMECWREPGCRTDEDRADALAVAMKLGITFESLDFKQEYREKVWNYFLAEYEQGRVPNADVVCNREIKFGIFMKWALENGFSGVATGHYARIVAQKNNYYLAVPRDEWKDQTYFLNQIDRQWLPKIIFPLGEMLKSEVRELAAEKNLTAVAAKKDSTGVCFVGESFEIGKFLREKMGEQNGAILNLAGEQIGEHRGVWFYTIGQRSGLQIEVQNPNSQPLYVVGKNIDQNEIIVGFEEDTYTDRFLVRELNFLIPESEVGDWKKTEKWVRIRHTGDLIRVQEVKELAAGKWEVKLTQKVKGVNDGQFAVFYDGGEPRICLGGGVIEI